MPQLFSRRKLIGVGGAAALVPIAANSSIGQAASLPTVVTGPVFALFDPIRVFDSRSALPAFGGGKIVAGNSIGVSVGGIVGSGDPPAAVFVNVTITETEGSGFLVVRASDLSGERPLPATSNINWSQSGQTLANLVFTPVGGENHLEVHAEGNGRTHFILDVQGYIPLALV